VLLAVILLAACGGQHGTPSRDRPSAASPSSLPGDAPTTVLAGVVAAATTTVPQSRIRVRLTNDRGVALPGLTVRIQGPTAVSPATGADGSVDAVVAPGVYTATVDAGCTSDVDILRPGTAQIAAPSGQTVTGTLQLAAVRRIAVTAPSSFQRVDPPDYQFKETWHVGQRYQVMFAVFDRCTGDGASNASLRDTVFVPGPGFQLVGPPPAMTATGHGAIDLTCTTPDAEPHLIARSDIDDRDAVDLLSYDALNAPVPSCVP